MTGLLVTLDGPGGTGKTTATAAAAAVLRRRGRPVHATGEPSAGPVGTLARSLVNQVTGHALACLVAADRYHHLATDIRPGLAAGHIVVCDRRPGLDPGPPGPRRPPAALAPRPQRAH